MSSPLTLTQTLLIKAAEDEAALKADGLSESILGFHAQQAIEKLMNALLSSAILGVRSFQITHDLEKLRALLVAAGETLLPTPLSFSDLTD
jgi:HEPN domain-containing protein